jgi:hypothetical protein
LRVSTAGLAPPFLFADISGYDAAIPWPSRYSGNPMDIHLIRNDDDCAAALREIERLWGAAAGTEEGDKLDILATLVEKYEERPNAHWPRHAMAIPRCLTGKSLAFVNSCPVHL